MGRSSDITQDQISVTLCGWISGDSFSRTLNGTPPSATLVSTRSPAFGTQLYVIVRRLRPILLSLLFASVCLPQSAEERPALCGMGLSNLSLPSNVTVESDSLLIRSRLTLRTANSSSTIDLPAVSQIQQVCDVAPNKLVVFGLEAPAVYSINIIDKNTWRVLDSFEGFSPALSPDKHYVVFRKFYPRQTSLPVSEEYLLYDLDKDWKQNRGVGLSEKETVSVGVVIYPLGRPNTNADDLGLPADQLHVFRSTSFYWAPDSHSVVFADSVQDQLSIILVRTESQNVSTTVHLVSASEYCDATTPLGRLTPTVFDAQIYPTLSGIDHVEVQFTRTSCGAPNAVLLHVEDFRPAKVEPYVAPHLRPAFPG